MLTGAVERRWVGGPLTTEDAQRLWAAMPLTIPALVNQAPDLIGMFVPAEPLYTRAMTFEFDLCLRLESPTALVASRATAGATAG